MRARLVLSLALGAVLVGGAAASATDLPDVPVGVHTGDDGVCVTISKMVPQCVPVSTS